jgi:hypothetical protein
MLICAESRNDLDNERENTVSMAEAANKELYDAMPVQAQQKMSWRQNDDHIQRQRNNRFAAEDNPDAADDGEEESGG